MVVISLEKSSVLDHLLSGRKPPPVDIVPHGSFWNGGYVFEGEAICVGFKGIAKA